MVYIILAFIIIESSSLMVSGRLPHLQ